MIEAFTPQLEEAVKPVQEHVEDSFNSRFPQIEERLADVKEFDSKLEQHSFHKQKLERESIMKTQLEVLDRIIEKLNAMIEIKKKIEAFLVAPSDIPKTNRDLLEILSNSDAESKILEILHVYLSREKPSFQITDFSSYDPDIKPYDAREVILEKTKVTLDRLAADTNEIYEYLALLKPYNSQNQIMRDEIDARFIDMPETNRDLIISYEIDRYVLQLEQLEAQNQILEKDIQIILSKKNQYDRDLAEMTSRNILNYETYNTYIATLNEEITSLQSELNELRAKQDGNNDYITRIQSLKSQAESKLVKNVEYDYHAKVEEQHKRIQRLIQQFFDVSDSIDDLDSLQKFNELISQNKEYFETSEQFEILKKQIDERIVKAKQEINTAKEERKKQERIGAIEEVLIAQLKKLQELVPLP